MAARVRARKSPRVSEIAAGILEPQNDLVLIGRHRGDRGNLFTQVRYGGRANIALEIEHEHALAVIFFGRGGLQVLLFLLLFLLLALLPR